MNFFESFIAQASKTGQPVCGDHCLCVRSPHNTLLIVCDGVGSGIYANIASISCANRLAALLEFGMSLQSACEVVAESMNRARREDIPFAAFSAVSVLPNGSFTVYSYESPDPILRVNGEAHPLKPRFYTIGYEIIGESSGVLAQGDTISVLSDGVSQAGLGNGYVWGIGADGVAAHWNERRGLLRDLNKLGQGTLEMTSQISGGFHTDDTTVATLLCREASALTVLSGPPSVRNLDRAYVEAFLAAEGRHIICGSTTTEIVSRETGRPVTMAERALTAASPPEYAMEGIDMVAEGAMLLSQAHNIIGEDLGVLDEDSPAQKLCSFLHAADCITFMVGDARNQAHADLIFKQVGVLARQSSIAKMAEKLRGMGKLVHIEYY